MEDESTSLFDYIEGTMNDVVELERIVSIRETLYVKRIVLFWIHWKIQVRKGKIRLKSDHIRNRNENSAEDLVANDGDANDHLLFCLQNSKN